MGLGNLIHSEYGQFSDLGIGDAGNRNLDHRSSIMYLGCPFGHFPVIVLRRI
jgi:hypothetical protein